MPDVPRLPDRPAHTSQHKHLEPLDGHVERLRRSGRQRKPRLGEKKKVGIEDRTMRSAPWGRVDRLHPTVHDSFRSVVCPDPGSVLVAPAGVDLFSGRCRDSPTCDDARQLEHLFVCVGIRGGCVPQQC